MAKQLHTRSHTEIEKDGVRGYNLEERITISDSLVPTADELRPLQDLDPKFSEFFMQIALKEQDNRHESHMAEVETSNAELKRSANNEILGMILAFLCVLVFGALTALSLYLESNIMAGIFGVFGISSIVGSFVKGRK